jgi:prepilin-type N-terminal cleavage/methylation domain-containing protein
MKSHFMVAPQRPRHRGFTLLELLVVLVIIAILAALTLGAFRYAQESSARNRTVAGIGAIKAALERYKEKFGEYPEPANPTESDNFTGNTFNTGAAHMLYQAITGDGNSAIRLASPPPAGTAESDGAVDEREQDQVLGSSVLPKGLIYPPNAPANTPRARLLVDGWGRPYQYTKANADPAIPPSTVNPTYDLWSFGPLKNAFGSVSGDLESKRNEQISGAWITNWR